jgi:hypothetical protein
LVPFPERAEGRYRGEQGNPIAALWIISGDFFGSIKNTAKKGPIVRSLPSRAKTIGDKTISMLIVKTSPWPCGFRLQRQRAPIRAPLSFAQRDFSQIRPARRLEDNEQSHQGLKRSDKDSVRRLLSTEFSHPSGAAPDVS